MREQEPEDSLTFSRRGTCGENEGESTDSETREKEVCRERATSTPPPPEGEGEEEASPPTPDTCPGALPPLSLDRGRAGGEGAPPDTTPGAPWDPPGFPCPPKGREEEAEEVPGHETPEEVPRGGRSAEQGAQSPKAEIYVLCKIFSYQKRPLLSRPNSTKVTCHVPGAYPTPTPSTSGVGIAIKPSQEGTTLPGSHSRTNP